MRFMLEKRNTSSTYMQFVVPAVAFVIALVLGGFILLASGANPFKAYGGMIKGAFGSPLAWRYTILKAIPLLLCGLAVSVAFKLKFWNIGAEGQFVWGVVGVTWVMQFWTFLPTPMLLPVGLVIGIMAGAIWAGIPAILKAQWQVDETLTTLMLNYVAIKFAEYLYIRAWKAPKSNMGTPTYPKSAWMPALWGRGPSAVHLGLIIALVLVVILWFVLYKTKWGFELNMIGKNPTAARCQGVNIKKNIILALLLSGAIAGLAGGIEAVGVKHSLSKGVDAGHGFTGIIIAWMSGLNPYAAVFVSVIMAALFTGADSLQQTMRLPAAMGEVLQGLILLPLLAGSVFTDYRLRVIKKEAV